VPLPASPRSDHTRGIRRPAFPGVDFLDGGAAAPAAPLRV